MKNINILLESFKKHEMTKEGKESIFKVISNIDFRKKGAINEALIYSYNPNKIKKYIKKYFDLEEWQYRIVKTCNNITGLNIVMPDLSDRIEELKKVLNENFGWYYTNGFEWKNDNGQTYKVLCFRPKFSDYKEIEKEILKNPYLWHVTPFLVYQKIKKQGLIPKAKNTKFEYPDKIYFLPGNFKYEDAVECYKNISRFSKYKDDRWVILKVNVIDEQGNVPKFYYDPDYTGAIYTYESIRPNKIELINIIEPKKKKNLKETIEYIKKMNDMLDNPMTYESMILI